MAAMRSASVPAMQPLCNLDFGRRDLQAPVSMRNRSPLWVSSKKKALVDMVATAEGGGPIACFLTYTWMLTFLGGRAKTIVVVA